MGIARVTFEAPPPVKKPKAKKRAKKLTKRQRTAIAKAEARRAKMAAIAKVPKAGAQYEPDNRLGFEPLIQRGADLLMELRRLEANPKLSAAAFMREALSLANKDEAAIRALDERIQRGPATEAVASFCRKLARELSERNYPSLPVNRMVKVLTLHGTPDVLPQLGIIGASLADAFAVAVLLAVQRFGEKFGIVEDRNEYISKCDTLRKRIANIHALMRQKIQPADLLMETRSLTPTQRREGLMRQRIRRHPGVLYSADDWPAEVLERELLASGGKPQVVEPAPEPAPKSGRMADDVKAQLSRQATTAIVVPMQSAM